MIMTMFTPKTIVVYALLALQHIGVQVGAFPTGAGQCIGDMAAVGEPHLNRDFVSSGSLLEATTAFRINSTDLVPGETYIYQAGDRLIWSLQSGQYAYRGFLVRIEGDESNFFFSVPYYAINEDGTKDFDGITESLICEELPGNVLGVTHASSIPKIFSNGTMSFRLGSASSGIVKIDVTVVFVNNATTGSIFAHDQYTLQIQDGTSAPTSVDSSSSVPSDLMSDVPSIVPPPVSEETGAPSPPPVLIQTDAPSPPPVLLQTDAPSPPPVLIETNAPSPPPAVVETAVPTPSVTDPPVGVMDKCIKMGKGMKMGKGGKGKGSKGKGDKKEKKAKKDDKAKKGKLEESNDDSESEEVDDEDKDERLLKTGGKVTEDPCETYAPSDYPSAAPTITSTPEPTKGKGKGGMMMGKGGKGGEGGKKGKGGMMMGKGGKGKGKGGKGEETIAPTDEPTDDEPAPEEPTDDEPAPEEPKGKGGKGGGKDDMDGKGGKGGKGKTEVPEETVSPTTPPEPITLEPTVTGKGGKGGTGKGGKGGTKEPEETTSPTSITAFSPAPTAFPTFALDPTAYPTSNSKGRK